MRPLRLVPPGGCPPSRRGTAGRGSSGIGRARLQVQAMGMDFWLVRAQALRLGQEAE